MIGHGWMSVCWLICDSWAAKPGFGPGWPDDRIFWLPRLAGIRIASPGLNDCPGSPGFGVVPDKSNLEISLRHSSSSLVVFMPFGNEFLSTAPDTQVRLLKYKYKITESNLCIFSYGINHRF
jgi:hypothetical protein